MNAKAWEPGPMMRKLAAGEEPYGTGPWDSNHIELDQRDAAAVVAAFDRLRAIEREVVGLLEGGTFDRLMPYSAQPLRALVDGGLAA